MVGTREEIVTLLGYTWRGALTAEGGFLLELVGQTATGVHVVRVPMTGEMRKKLRDALSGMEVVSKMPDGKGNGR